MLITVLTLVAALQSQTPAPVARPAVSPPPASAPAPAPPEAAAPVAEPEVEAEPEVDADAAPTRQVCRFVEAPGRRFPIRRCRTVPVED